jgi:HD-GYP domain-containing protein (c-di-GMP phosphodiesterase class II)
MAGRKKASKSEKKRATKRVKKEIILETYDDFDVEMTELQLCRAKIAQLEKEMSILREVSEITNKDFDLNKLLERFLEIVMTAIGADAGSILLTDKLSDTLVFTVALGKKGHELKGVRLQMGEGIAGWVAQCGKPLITPDVQKDPRFSPKISKAINYATRNIVCAPLKFEDDILGVVELLNKHKGKAFDEKDLHILQSFVPYISVIIKNAQLFLENKKRIHRLEHLMELTEYVNSVLDLETLFEKILETSTDTLTAEAGSIMLVDEEKGDLTFAAATGTKAEKLKDIRVPIGEGIAGWVARENKPVLIADAQKDPRFFKKADQKTEFKTKSIIAVPLKTKDKLIGVMEVLNKKSNEPFNEEDVSMLEALSNQAAVAIENGRLYANLRELFINTVRSLATAIETKDVYTRGHSERVTMFAEMIADELGFSAEEIENLNLAGLLHDIGKIGVDDAILRKPAKLTPAEFEEIKKHPGFAANILEAIPQLKHIIPAIRHHHERYDGMGYPDGLKGENIPYFARIISVADTFDAMNSSRPYRQALSFDVCLDEVKRCAGTQFDPEIAAAAVKAFKKWNELFDKNEKEK